MKTNRHGGLDEDFAHVPLKIHGIGRNPYTRAEIRAHNKAIPGEEPVHMRNFQASDYETIEELKRTYGAQLKFGPPIYDFDHLLHDNRCLAAYVAKSLLPAGAQKTKLVTLDQAMKLKAANETTYHEVNLPNLNSYSHLD